MNHLQKQMGVNRAYERGGGGGGGGGGVQPIHRFGARRTKKGPIHSLGHRLLF
jgi:hypothetical protein